MLFKDNTADAKSLKVLVAAKVLEDGPCSEKTYEFLRFFDFDPPLQMCGLFNKKCAQNMRSNNELASLEAIIKHKFRNKVSLQKNYNYN